MKKSRLAAPLALAIALAPASMLPEEPTRSKWKRGKIELESQGKQRGLLEVLEIKAEKGISVGQSSNPSAFPVFAIFCRTTFIVMLLDEKSGGIPFKHSRKTIDLTFRFDNGAARRFTAGVIPYEAAGLFMSPYPLSFMDPLTESKRMFLGFTQADGSYQETFFEIAGFAEAALPFLEECKKKDK